MRKTVLALAATAAVFSAPALHAREHLTGEQKLAKLLEGRVPGKPVSCISTFANRDSQVIDKTAIVYGSGDTIYVNTPRYPESLDSDDIMVVELHGSELCRLDSVRMHDRSGFFYNGFVGLSDFVPYRRIRRD